MAEAIIKLHDNPKLAKKMGENGMRAVELRYNWNVDGERLCRLYEQLER